MFLFIVLLFILFEIVNIFFQVSLVMKKNKMYFLLNKLNEIEKKTNNRHTHTQKMSFLLYLIITWFSSITTSFIIKLYETWFLVLNEYNEQCNLNQDCSFYEFAKRYPVRCAEITIKPPKMFIHMWFSKASENVNWCGPIACEYFLSTSPLIIASFLFLIFKTQQIFLPKLYFTRKKKIIKE